MTLLMVETQRIDAAFGRRWQAWQHAQRWTSPDIHPGDPVLFDHFPFAIYEYFPTVGFRAARHVAMAARAMGMAATLRHAASRGGGADQVDRACEWLLRLARDELETVIEAQSSFWRSFAAASAEPPLSCATAAAFAALAGQAERLAPVNESQVHFYAGLRLRDALLSWQEDFLHDRPSPVVAALVTETGAGGTGSRAEQLPVVARHFHYGGPAERTLETVIDHFSRALAAVADLPSGAWVAVMARFLQDAQRLGTDLGRIRRERLARVRRGAVAPAACRNGTAASASTAASAIVATDNAADYINREQDPAGNWGDFLLLGQQSTAWVTGYVGWNLVGGADASPELGAAAAWLIGHQAEDGGWGYNRHWPVDLDSTANALLFLTTRPEVRRDRWQPALERLLAAQRGDGSFSTITDTEAWLVRFRAGGSDLRGWTSPHPCVTAAITLLLGQLPGRRERTAAAQGLAYLLRCQRPEGSWDAYWWTGRLYTTCRTVQAACALGAPEAAAALRRAGRWLVGDQCPDGGWAARQQDGSGAFSTALAIQALCALRTARTVPRADIEAVDGAVSAGVRWLLGHQRSDGSWPGQPMLRVPRPEVVAPWEQDTWTESIVGLDVVVPDWRRLFTTATCIRALRAAVGTSDPSHHTSGSTPPTDNQAGARYQRASQS